MQVLSEPAAVWFASNDGHEALPVRMVLRGERWRVTDRPTRVPAEWWSPVMTHAPAERWRFQGTNGEGLSRIFDVRLDGAEWIVERIYD